jgi:hypothetical protein
LFEMPSSYASSSCTFRGKTKRSLALTRTIYLTFPAREPGFGLPGQVFNGKPIVGPFPVLSLWLPSILLK